MDDGREDFLLCTYMLSRCRSDHIGSCFCRFATMIWYREGWAVQSNMYAVYFAFIDMKSPYMVPWECA